MRSLLIYIAVVTSFATSVANAASFYEAAPLKHAAAGDAGVTDWKEVKEMLGHDTASVDRNVRLKLKRQDGGSSSSLSSTSTESGSSTVTVTKSSSSQSATESGSVASTSTTTASDTGSVSSTTTETGSRTQSETATATGTTSDGPPTPWISRDEDGIPHTIVPYVTTNSAGETLTVDAPPADSTLTNPPNDGESHSVFVDCTANDYESPDYAPFCSPRSSSVWLISGSSHFYYVTWNPAEFADNSSVVVTLNYYNSSGADGVFDIGPIPAAYGFTTIHPKDDWITDKNAPSMLFYFLIRGSGNNGKPGQGPKFTISRETLPMPTPEPKKPISTTGLAIGIPVVVIFIIGMVAGTHFCMRESRTIGPIHIGGVRGRSGYGVRKSRRQRMKGAPVVDSPGNVFSEEMDTPGAHSKRDSAGSGGWELTDVRGGGYRDSLRDDPFREETRGRV